MLQQIKAKPDATLQERAEQWEQTHGLKLSRSTFSRSLKRLKLTYKKSLKASERDERVRTEFGGWQAALEVKQLRVLDERVA